MTQPKSKVTLTFDGGSRGNPGPAYGSYLLDSRDLRLRRLQRLSFGEGTNNEAEYWTLLAGLRDLLGELEAKSIPSASVELAIRGDSRLVLEQIAGRWKAKNARMRQLALEVRDLLGAFNIVHPVHQARSRSVRLLGH
jgi:probable phosphoglycerate mutase